MSTAMFIKPNLFFFPILQYLGTWFDVASYNTVFQQGTCNTAFYSPGFGGSVDVLNTQVVNQRLATMLGNAQVASTDGTAKLDVTFPIGGTNCK